MAKYGRFKSFSRAPRRKAPTAAQIAASEKAWREALGSVHGRFSKGSLVVDYRGMVWKLTRGGRAYHEDSSSRLYPAMPARAPKAFKASEVIRAAIEHILHQGHHEPFSRGGTPETQKPCPFEKAEVRWTDRKINSYAQLPSIEVCGDVLRAIRPNYDDAPSVAWIQDKKLARQVMKAIQEAPEPVHLPKVEVRPRGAYAAAMEFCRGMQALTKS